MDLEAEESASHPTLLPCLSKGGAARNFKKHARSPDTWRAGAGELRER